MPIDTGFVKCKEFHFTEEKEPDFERKHTRNSVFLIHKWICEGMTPALVGSILNRSEKNVLLALRVPLEKNELLMLRKYFSPYRSREINFLDDSCIEQQNGSENDED